MVAIAKTSSGYSSKKSIYFPFRIKCDLPSFNVADDLVIQRMSDKDKERLLRITDVEYDKEGRLKKFTFLKDDPFSIFGPQIDNYDEYYASNFMLRAPSRERAEEFNLALKLCGHSISSLMDRAR